MGDFCNQDYAQPNGTFAPGNGLHDEAKEAGCGFLAEFKGTKELARWCVEESMADWEWDLRTENMTYGYEPEDKYGPAGFTCYFNGVTKLKNKKTGKVAELTDSFCRVVYNDEGKIEYNTWNGPDFANLIEASKP